MVVKVCRAEHSLVRGIRVRVGAAWRCWFTLTVAVARYPATLNRPTHYRPNVSSICSTET